MTRLWLDALAAVAACIKPRESVEIWRPRNDKARPVQKVKPPSGKV